MYVMKFANRLELNAEEKHLEENYTTSEAIHCRVNFSIRTELALGTMTRALSF